MSANPAFWSDGWPRSQGNAFTYQRAEESGPSARTLRRREISAAYRVTEKGRAVKAKSKAKAKARRIAGLVDIPSSAVLQHDEQQKTKPAGGSFRTI